MSDTEKYIAGSIYSAGDPERSWREMRSLTESRTCAWCGETFEVDLNPKLYWNRKRRTCGPGCQEKHRLRSERERNRKAREKKMAEATK